MVKITYTDKQREILLQNRNVAKLGKTITYTEDFKIKAVKQYQEEYITPRDIFIQAGFDVEIIGKKKPEDCLERWNKVYTKRGLKGLSDTKGKRGRPKKVKDKPDRDKIERLEAENAYLKAENDFLAKLRAKRKY